ncbi:MAG: T9SS type A sorting domain-containing protein, partial [Sediminibacterium sp.]
KNVLSPFGVFIARANGNNNNKLLFTEHCKTVEPFTDSISTMVLDDIFYIELRLETDSILWDRLLIMQMDSARAGFDRNDAEKFTNPGVNFYSLSREQKMLSIDARPLTTESIIPLGIQTNEAASMSIRVTRTTLPAYLSLMLHDRYLNKWMMLEKDSIYYFNTTNDTASAGNKRFEIRGPQKPVDTVLKKAGIILKINPIPAKYKILVQYKAPEKGNTSIRILSLSGTPLKNIQLGLQKEGQVIVPVGDLVSGLYLLEIKCGNEVSTQKIIKD